MRKIKYPRIEKKDGNQYVTGDAQDWTYQYTWEDLEESSMILPLMPMQ